MKPLNFVEFGIVTREAIEFICCDDEGHGYVLTVDVDHSYKPGGIVLTPEERREAGRGDRIEAIKMVRSRTGRGLKEAKDAVWSYLGL